MLTGIAGLALGLTTAVGIGAWSGAPVFVDNLLEWDIDVTPYGNIHKLIDTADFDQDGFDDLLAVHEYAWEQYQLVVHINQSGKGFTPVFALNGNSAFNYRAADINGDGYPDLVKTTIDSLDNRANALINQLANEKVCATDLDKSGSTEIGDLLFVIEDWGPCQDK